MDHEPVDVVVIGAGQAGLSAGYHLRRRGFEPISQFHDAESRSTDAGTFVVLDANERPGGAWQHRWPSLRMATVNGIHELPGYPVPSAEPHAASRDVLPPYFREYEEESPSTSGGLCGWQRYVAPTPTRPGGFWSRRTPGLGGPLRHQRHRHLDAPLLAALSRPVALPRPPAARR